MAHRQRHHYPRRQPQHVSDSRSSTHRDPRQTHSAKKSHAVLAKEGSRIKLIRFGQQGVRGAGKDPQTPKEKARRRSFKARHAKNIKKGKMSAAYWADKVKW